jgi:hypothetical protein
MFHATHLPGSFGNTMINAKSGKFSQFLAFGNGSQASGKVPNLLKVTTQVPGTLMSL